MQHDFQVAYEKAATAVKNRYKLEQCMQHLEVSTQILLWKQGGNLFTNVGQTINKSYLSNTLSKGFKK